jgi:hypothetical protein
MSLQVRKLEDLCARGMKTGEFAGTAAKTSKVLLDLLEHVPALTPSVSGNTAAQPPPLGFAATAYSVWNLHTANGSCIQLQLLKLKLIFDRQSVGQSVLVSGAHLGPLTNFSFSLKFLSDICVFVIL